jgi:hypothetical protein
MPSFFRGLLPKDLTFKAARDLGLGMDGKPVPFAVRSPKPNEVLYNPDAMKEYPPERRQELLAHEITHSIQFGRKTPSSGPGQASGLGPVQLYDLMSHGHTIHDLTREDQSNAMGDYYRRELYNSRALASPPKGFNYLHVETPNRPVRAATDVPQGLYRTLQEQLNQTSAPIPGDAVLSYLRGPDAGRTWLPPAPLPPPAPFPIAPSPPAQGPSRPKR